jgi:TRAP-type C4-dicarboxylate transport system permease small subunit
MLFSTGTRLSNKEANILLGKVADCGNKVVSPVSRVLNYICMVVLVLATLLVVADVCLRRFFNSPIHGTSDLESLAFSIIVFCSLAWCAVNNRHVELDLITRRLPKTVQRVLELIMVFITTVILGVMSWQILKQGMALQSYNQKSTILGIPMYPFLYVAAFGSLIVALAFLVRLIYTINNLRADR